MNYYIMHTTQNLDKIEDKILCSYLNLHFKLFDKPIIFCFGKTRIIELFDDALATLTEREEAVIRLRFGLDTGVFLTLQKVGERFGLTKERIRQIEAKALRKLKHPTRSRKILDIFQFSCISSEAIKNILVDEITNQIPKSLGEYTEKYLNVNKISYEIDSINSKIVPLNDVMLEDLDLSVRAYYCLKRAGICTLSDVLRMSDDNLKHVKNLGRNSYKEIKGKLYSLGLAFPKSEAENTNENITNTDFEAMPTTKFTISFCKENDKTILKIYNSKIKVIAADIIDYLFESDDFIFNKQMYDEIKLIALKNGFWTEQLFFENYKEIYTEACEYINQAEYLKEINLESFNRCVYVIDKDNSIDSKESIVEAIIKEQNKSEEVNEFFDNSKLIYSKEIKSISQISNESKFILNENDVMQKVLEHVKNKNFITKYKLALILCEYKIKNYYSKRIENLFKNHSIVISNNPDDELKELFDIFVECIESKDDDSSDYDELYKLLDFGLSSKDISFLYNKLLRKYKNFENPLIQAFGKKEFKLILDKKEYDRELTLDTVFDLIEQYGFEKNEYGELDEIISYIEKHEILPEKDIKELNKKYNDLYIDLDISE